MSDGRDIIALVAQRQDCEQFRRKNWVGTFAEYLNIVRERPEVTRTAYQRLYDMILSYGVDVTETGREKHVHYRFFDDPDSEGRDAVFGLDVALHHLVNALKSAAAGYGIERRVLLLHGPVGSSKSTIARMVKKGLERYSSTDDGALYTLGWVDDNDPDNSEAIHWCPMNEEPLHLFPQRFRPDVEAELNAGRGEDDQRVHIDGELDPFCRFMYYQRLKKYDGDWSRVVQDVRVKRLILSEKDRVGIGTFQPKDEKNQDATELTGDINYRKIAEYGSDSDPRAFNFDGEFNISNRGVIEFVEVLKLDVAFLYDLLGASQEHRIKPKKFAQTDIDEVIIGHTNEPEYRRLQNNEFMEALRDRTVKIDVPYVTSLANEVKIYEKDYNKRTVRGKHIAPHTIEMAAMWAVLTRLEEPKHAGLTRLQKLKLYNGKTLPGFTEENIKELREHATQEGMIGISPRYVQDKISNALVAHPESKSINPFMVLNELESGLKHHSLITNEDTKQEYRELLGVVKEEYENIVKNEVQRAIAADDEALKRLCGNYIDNVKAYTQKEKVKNRFTGKNEDPDERLMRSIEEKIDIPDSRKDDFRREIMNYIGALSIDGKTFDYKTNERLYKALELKLFEDQKDSIKLTSLVSNVIDAETQQKIDVVKGRLIQNYGYDDESATDVLNYVASILREEMRRRSNKWEGEAPAEPRTDSGSAGASPSHPNTMIMKIERDQRRFRQIVRGRIRQNLRKYVTHGEMIGRKGRDLVSIPVPSLDVPHFRFGDNGAGGVGQGDGEEGQPIARGGDPKDGAGQAGSDPGGGHLLEVDISLEELAEIMGEELELPRIEPRGNASIIQEKSKYNTIRQTGPESLRHFKRTYLKALKRQISTGVYEPDEPRVVPIKADKQYRSWTTVEHPDVNAAVIYMMDVSGSMTDEQKEIVRTEAFWIDTWLASQYKGIETRYIIHDAVAKEVDEHTFYYTRESGGTRISSAYKAAARLIEDQFPPSEWNLYCFQFSDGDNWGEDNEEAFKVLGEHLLPIVNLFCYGQVESPYGSGEFLGYLQGRFGDKHESLVLSEIEDKEAIYESIKMFLGKGR